MTGHAHPAVNPTALSRLSSGDFIRVMGEINTTANAATVAYKEAMDNLRLLLTEQTARAAAASHPSAALVFTRVAAQFHHHPDGSPSTTCTGHAPRLVATSAVDKDGNELPPFDLLSPIHYLLERLTPIIGLEAQVLDTETREWIPDVVGA